MAFNGEGPYSKRMRTDGESMGQKNGPYGYNDYDNQPRRRLCLRSGVTQIEPVIQRLFVSPRNIMSVAYPMLVDTYHELLNHPVIPNPLDIQLQSSLGCHLSSWGSYDSLFSLGILPIPELGCVPTASLDMWKGEPENPNHVILITILSPAYPITVDVIHTICTPYGNVLRIVIFKKNGVQAMVEFDNVETATRAKDGLQGADIYSGCCTLRIEYAKPTKLNVFKNDAESWDFTNPTLNQQEKPSGGSSRPPLLQEPRLGLNASPFRGGMSGMGGGPRNTPSLFSSPISDSFSGSFSGSRFGMGSSLRNGSLRGGAGLAGAGPGSGGPFMGGAGGPSGPSSMPSLTNPSHGIPNQGAVLMVYGLNKDQMNCDRLFNLLCLYGNVVRVKFLKTKEGCAMVQMGDSLAVERSIENLNNTTFFGNKMQLGYSKQAFLADVQQPYNLPDATPSFKDYMGNKNNRFINPEMASKNRIQPPSKILHFFNTPPQLTEDVMNEVFGEMEITQPKQMKVFPSKTDRSSSGLLEFNNMSEALEALVCANHASIPNPNSKFPYIMKLCFSSSRHIPTSKNDEKMSSQD